MEHGELFRKLRKERGLSQLEISKDVSARETLTRFENKNSNVSLEHFLGYLNNLGIEFNEYHYIYNQFIHNEYDMFRNEFMEAIKTKKSFSEFISKTNIKYTLSNDSFYKRALCQAKLLNNRLYLNDKEELTDEIEYLMNYLSKIEIWGRSELVIFSNTMFAYPTDYIINNYNVFVKNIDKRYIKIPYYNQLYSDLLINLSYIMIERERFDIAKEQLDLAKKYSEKNSNLLNLIQINCLSCYLDNNKNFTVSLIDDELGILRKFGFDKKAKGIVIYFEKIMEGGIKSE